MRTSPFVVGSGPDARLTAVLTDVTGAVELETELARASEEATATAQQLAAFIAGVSHEIRTPLNGVIGLADHLLTTKLDAEQHADLYTLKTTGDQLVACSTTSSTTPASATADSSSTAPTSSCCPWCTVWRACSRRAPSTGVCGCG